MQVLQQPILADNLFALHLQPDDLHADQAADENTPGG